MKVAQTPSLLILLPLQNAEKSWRHSSPWWTPISLDDALADHDIARELDTAYTGEVDQDSISFWTTELEGLERSYGVATSGEEEAAAVVKAALNQHLDVEAYRAAAIDDLDDQYDLEEELDPFYDPSDPDASERESVYVRIEPV